MTTHPAQRPPSVPRLTLVTMPACHYCEDAHEVLARLESEGRVAVRTLDAESPEGRTLIDLHRPSMFPLVLVDGDVLGSGRLSRHRLARALGMTASEL